MGCRRILLYIWLVSLTLTFIGCKGSSGTESAMCRANPQRTGVYSSPAVTEPPELKWKFKIAPERTGVYSSAVIAGLGLYSYPVIASGVVYFGSYCSGLHAVDAETGKEKWRFGIEDWAGTPVVAGGIVFFGSSYGSDQCVLYAVDIRTKEEKWSFQLEGGVLDVAVADGIVYLTGAKGTMETATGILYAVDVKTGMERWRFQKQGNLLSPPAIEDELVYISSDSAFYALNAKTGKEKWKCKIYDRLGCKGFFPAVADGVVYFAGVRLYAVDAKTGEVKWILDGESNFWSQPAVVDGVLYCSYFFPREGTSPALCALDAETGKVKWKFQIEGQWQQISSPVIAGGIVYVGSSDGYLYAVDSKTGQEKWKFKAEDIVFSPTIADGVVYFVSSGNEPNADLYLYAVE